MIPWCPTSSTLLYRKIDFIDRHWLNSRHFIKSSFRLVLSLRHFRRFARQITATYSKKWVYCTGRSFFTDVRKEEHSDRRMDKIFCLYVIDNVVMMPFHFISILSENVTFCRWRRCVTMICCLELERFSDWLWLDGRAPAYQCRSYSGHGPLFLMRNVFHKIHITWSVHLFHFHIVK